jgi:glyoxylase-like metal-dependent hydrolase (beta-lactamase superfamily II)
MNRRWLLAIGTGVILGFAAWFGSRGDADDTNSDWENIVPGVLRTKQMPYGYALIDNGHAMLIDAPWPGDGLKAHGVKTIDGVLLTHHHRDSVAAVESYLNARVPVRAPKLAAELLTPDGVAKYWKESIPLRGSRTSYFVVPNGFTGIDCTLEDGQKLNWRGRTIHVVGTPGHSRDHLSFSVTNGKEKTPLIFAGDAIAERGKLWSPFTTDWDHWTDLGLKPTHESLRKLAALKPKVLYPAHGRPIAQDAVKALEDTATAVEEVAFLKSFTRFSERIGNVPKYNFLVPKEQVASAGDKPWSRVSEHLWITGNTYVLVSKQEQAFLVLDPWGQRSADQIAKLKKDQKLGSLERVLFSHAHFDHYDGIHNLPDREQFKVWTLDRVAEAIADPNRLRAPFLDARPVAIDQRFKDGDKAAWREYNFRFHFFPGQTEYTMAIETSIDGKKCLFTADNFYHQDQFSGSGGWMGLNRSFPLPYASSAQKVLDIAPEWVLAEHGGPFEFNAEDFKRRVQWGEASAKAADAISISGNHRRDWDPHRVTVEPVIVKAKAGANFTVEIRTSNPADQADKVLIELQGRGLTEDRKWVLDVPAGKSVAKSVTIGLNRHIPSGRHILIIRNADRLGGESVDAFLAVDVD